MAKYLMLSPDPSQRWELPPEADVEALRSKLLAAWSGGSPVPYIHVLIAGQHVPLYLHGGALPMFALLETPDTQPAVPDRFMEAQPGIMDGILDEPL